MSDGALIIRNQAGQQQDIAGLSRDVEHANNGATGERRDDAGGRE
nr:hypothetical protein [Dickeya dadantii]